MSRPIKELLHTFTQSSDNWQIRLVQNWHTIFGDLSRHITCQKIEHNTITLGVYDSCWMQELYALTPTLLTAINAALDTPHITQIRFKKVTRPVKKSVPDSHKTPFVLHDRILSFTEKQVLAQVRDAELRAALKKFLLRCTS
jgi:Dna[CI] antecedent, DciA